MAAVAVAVAVAALLLTQLPKCGSNGDHSSAGPSVSASASGGEAPSGTDGGSISASAESDADDSQGENGEESVTNVEKQTSVSESAEDNDAASSMTFAEPVSMGQLLADLVEAYEKPSVDNLTSIDSDLQEMKDSNQEDFGIAKAIVENWNEVYTNSQYRLFYYEGGELASSLANVSIPDRKTHAFVVLGSALSNGEMQDELRGRCDAAAAAARSYPEAMLVCSGGSTGDNNPNGYTEAGLMKDYLVNECGIDKSRVVADERGTSTAENAIYVMDTLRALGIKTMTLITSSYHQRRAQAIHNALAASYKEHLNYAIEIIGNYNYRIEDNPLNASDEARVTARQVGEVLGLPDDEIELIPYVEW